MASKLWSGRLSDGRVLTMRELTVAAMDECAMAAGESHPSNAQLVQQEAIRLSYMASIVRVGDLSMEDGATPEEMYEGLARMRGQMQLLWSKIHNTTDEEDEDFLASVVHGAEPAPAVDGARTGATG